eukprot:6038928-Pleurochrysis_carterae.AAC.1
MVELPDPGRSGGHKDSFCASTPVESGGRGTLPSKTIGVGIDSSLTGVQSTTERSLVEVAVLVQTARLHQHSAEVAGRPG